MCLDDDDDDDDFLSISPLETGGKNLGSLQALSVIYVGNHCWRLGSFKAKS